MCFVARCENKFEKNIRIKQSAAQMVKIHKFRDAAAQHLLNLN